MHVCTCVCLRRVPVYAVYHTAGTRKSPLRSESRVTGPRDLQLCFVLAVLMCCPWLLQSCICLAQRAVTLVYGPCSERIRILSWDRGQGARGGELLFVVVIYRRPSSSVQQESKLLFCTRTKYHTMYGVIDYDSSASVYLVLRVPLSSAAVQKT